VDSFGWRAATAPYTSSRRRHDPFRAGRGFLCIVGRLAKGHPAGRIRTISRSVKRDLGSIFRHLARRRSRRGRRRSRSASGRSNPANVNDIEPPPPFRVEIAVRPSLTSSLLRPGGGRSERPWRRTTAVCPRRCCASFRPGHELAVSSCATGRPSKFRRSDEAFVGARRCKRQEILTTGFNSAHGTSSRCSRAATVHALRPSGGGRSWSTIRKPGQLTGGWDSRGGRDISGTADDQNLQNLILASAAA